MRFRTTKWRLMLIIVGVYVGVPGTLSALTIQGAADTELARMVRETDLVGAAAIIVVDGEVVDRAVSGERVLGSGEPVPEGAVWHIGSITKSITATLAATLVADGALTFETTLAEVFGERAVGEEWRSVSLQELLTHRSGAPANFPIGTMIRPDPVPATPEAVRARRREETLRVLSTTTPQDRGSFGYSNVGYTLAGAMLEEVTGSPYQRMLADRVFGPLGLSFRVGAPDGPDAVWGHRSGLLGTHPIDPSGKADNPRLMGPAGTLAMTLEDLAAYGHAHLVRDPRLFGETLFTRLRTPPVRDRAEEGYAYGWVTDPDGAGLGLGPVFWHNGSNTFWYTVLIVAPEAGVVIAISTNEGDLAAAGPAAFDLARRLAAPYARP